MSNNQQSRAAARAVNKGAPVVTLAGESSLARVTELPADQPAPRGPLASLVNVVPIEHGGRIAAPVITNAGSSVTPGGSSGALSVTSSDVTPGVKSVFFDLSRQLFETGTVAAVVERELSAGMVVEREREVGSLMNSIPADETVTGAAALLTAIETALAEDVFKPTGVRFTGLALGKDAYQALATLNDDTGAPLCPVWSDENGQPVHGVLDVAGFRGAGAYALDDAAAVLLRDTAVNLYASDTAGPLAYQEVSGMASPADVRLVAYAFAGAHLVSADDVRRINLVA